MYKYLIALAVLSVGCTVAVPRQIENATPAYRAGFTHGCASGEAAVGNWMREYTQLSNQSEEYNSAWAAGYDFCKERYKANSRLTR